MYNISDISLFSSFIVHSNIGQNSFAYYQIKVNIIYNNVNIFMQ